MERRSVLIAAAALAAVPGAPSRAPAQRPPAAEDRIGRGWTMMNSDLVLVGPAADPAGVAGLRDLAEALRRIAAVGAPFLSAGSGGGGTHEAEFRLWRAAGVDPAPGRGRWYREAVGGAPALQAAAFQNAYTLAERSAWLALRERRALRLFVEGDRRFSR